MTTYEPVAVVVLEGWIYSTHDTWEEAGATANRLARELGRQADVRVMSWACALSYDLVLAE